MSARRSSPDTRIPRVFRQLLVNTLLTGVTSTFLWFALTFWVYLETRSVVATGVIGGAFSISSAVLGPDRGLALMFTVAGIFGVAATVRAWTSRSYRRLAATTVDGAETGAVAPLAGYAT